MGRYDEYEIINLFYLSRVLTECKVFPALQNDKTVRYVLTCFNKLAHNIKKQAKCGKLIMECGKLAQHASVDNFPQYVMI